MDTTMEIRVDEYKKLIKSIALADAALDYLEVITKKDCIQKSDVVLALMLGGRDIDDIDD